MSGRIGRFRRHAALSARVGRGVLLCLFSAIALSPPAVLGMTREPDTDLFQRLSFDQLVGWKQDDHMAAFQSLLRFCERSQDPSANSDLLIDRDTLGKICSGKAQELIEGGFDARSFFERSFTPYRITEPGFITGYFEPEVAASRERTRRYTVPLHGKPSGLVQATDDNRPADWPTGVSHGRLVGGKLTEMPDRGAIMDGALDRESLEIAWLSDPIDAFLIHVQGSARLRLPDGAVMRIGYAGKTGHPYTSIGKRLVERGEGTPADFTMAGLRDWLSAHPEERDALFKENRSYIFFREVTEADPQSGPIGAAGLPLTAGRSLAIDARFIPYGALVFVSSSFAGLESGSSGIARLMVADDTGSAIKGAARGDVFVGSGPAAGKIAGDIRHAADFVILVPNSASAGEP